MRLFGRSSSERPNDDSSGRTRCGEVESKLWVCGKWEGREKIFSQSIKKKKKKENDNSVKALLQDIRYTT